MTKLVYLDCQTGIAGDMCLGALVDAGVPLEYLVEKLKGLGIEQEYQLRVDSVHRNGQIATKVHVDLLNAQHHHSSGHHHDHNHDHASDLTPNIEQKVPHDKEASHAPTRHLPEIERLITGAGLPSRVVEWSLSVFRKLAEAEGAVHGIAPEKVHFHEVGATDAIVDIVGTCLGLDWLGIDQLYCSALPTGGGTVRAAHGRLPVPVPAVLKLWESRQVPVYSNGIEREMVTPTGAALAVTLATHFGPPPAMTIQRVGKGAGSLQLPIPNILRLWIGESLEELKVGRLNVEGSDELKVGRLNVEGSDELKVGRLNVEGSNQSSNLQLSNLQPSNLQPSNLQPVTQTNLQPVTQTNCSTLETISVLETQIDDLSPQAIGYVFEALFNAGAVDVFTQAIGMKKSRPGVLLTVICHPQDMQACEAVLFQETTTLGVRRLMQQRAILEREIQTVMTEYGEIRVKIAWNAHSANKTITNIQPEYEDCAAIARAKNLTWREVHQLALQSWYRQYGQSR